MPTIWEKIAASITNSTPIYCKLPELETLPRSNHDLAALIINSLPPLPDQYFIAGWSLGGMLGALLTKYYPEKVAGLITVASSPKFCNASNWHGVTKANAASFQNHLIDNKESLLLHFRKLAAFPDNKKNNFTALCHYTAPQEKHIHLQNLLSILIKLDLRETYLALKRPAMHIYGLRDAILPAQCADQMRAQYPDHIIHSLHDAGHAAILSHPALLSAHISHFIGNIYAAA